MNRGLGALGLCLAACTVPSEGLPEVEAEPVAQSRWAGYAALPEDVAPPRGAAPEPIDGQADEPRPPAGAHAFEVVEDVDAMVADYVEGGPCPTRIIDFPVLSADGQTVAIAIADHEVGAPGITVSFFDVVDGTPQGRETLVHRWEWERTGALEDGEHRLRIRACRRLEALGKRLDDGGFRTLAWVGVWRSDAPLPADGELGGEGWATILDDEYSRQEEFGASDIVIGTPRPQDPNMFVDTRRRRRPDCRGSADEASMAWGTVRDGVRIWYRAPCLC